MIALANEQTIQLPLVLVADDEPTVGELIARMLRPLGFATVIVGDGAAAVRAVATYRAELACTLLDVQMPIMNGVDAANAIQQRVPGLPIVLMSGGMPAPLRARLGHLQHVGFLQKPFTRAELHAVIQAATVGAMRQVGE